MTDKNTGKIDFLKKPDKSLSFLIILFLFSLSGYGQTSTIIIDSLKNAYKNNETGKIIKMEEAVLQQDTLKAKSLYYLGWAFQNQYDFKKSINLLKKAHKIDTSDFKIIQLLGNSYIKCGQTKKAIKLFRTKYKTDSSNLWLANKLAELYHKTKNYPKSITIYQNLIQKDSSNYYYYKKLGNSLIKIDKKKKARNAYLSALKLNPNDLSLYSKLGNLFIKTKEPQKALKMAHSGLKKDTTNANLFTIAGYTHFKLTHFDTASHYFSKSLKYGDSTKLRLKYSGLSNYKMKNPEVAVNYLKSAYKKDTTDLQVMVFLGSALGQTGKTDKGLDYMFKSLKMIKPDKESLKHINREIAKIYTIKNKPKIALKYYKKAYKIYPTPGIAFQMAQIYDHELNKKKLARSYYESVLQRAKEKETSKIDTASKLKTQTSKKAISLAIYVNYAKKRIKQIKKESFFEQPKKDTGKQKTKKNQ